jgi:methylase of polypeptide subunit release factors
VISPVPDPAAAAALGAALRRLGYEGDAIAGLVGDDVTGELEDVLVAERRLSESPLETAIRLLYLELAVPERRVAAALGADVVDALLATRLVARQRGKLAPRSRIVPVDELLLASDGFTRDADDPPDYVATYTPTARTCDLLTPRPRCRRALDIGAGSGIHALLAARHAGHVVAVDVNRRALAYTELNAALNGLDNVECRAGSLFSPVDGETFDLIVCNAPYVVSPEQRWTYRDSGFRGDDLTAHLVGEAARHLAEGGYATLLGSWLIVDEDEPEARPAAWVAQTGCDAWILTALESDPLDHASSWNAAFFADALEYAAAIEQWTGYLSQLGAHGVGEGAILLHRSSGPGGLRVDEIDEEALEPADAQIRRAFANRERLPGLRGRHLLDARLARALPLRAEHELGRRTAELVLDGGTCSVLPTTVGAVGVVERLDGRTTLRSLGADARGLALCRELLGLGALRLAEPATKR